MELQQKFNWIEIILVFFLGIFLTILIYSYPQQSNDYNNRLALIEESNLSVTGVFFPRSSFCVDMSRSNIEELKETISHEFLHYLITKERCGNVTCYEHFCQNLSD